MSGFRIDTSVFSKTTKMIQSNVKKNTQMYGKVLAQTYEREAKGHAPWIDRRGNARMRLYGKSDTVGNRVRVEMGGAAPNYKPGPLAAKDYMEYLEFDHDKKYATIFPTAEAISADVVQKFGEAALEGKIRPRIIRNRKDLNARRKQMLINTAAAAGWWQNREALAYQKWLQDRSVFNR